MDDSVQVGFEDTLLEIEISRLSPIKKITPVTLASQKFKQIIASVKEIGVIEPLVVNQQGGHYVLLDGHLRLEALKIIGIDKTLCLLAKDDEAFTYNRYISRKAPIQEHRMIKKMVDNGVSEEKIAKTLNINVKSIMQKRSLLDGICEEVVELLKDKMVAQQVFLCLKKMKPTRQIECAMLMIDMNDFTSRYAKGLLAMSKETELYKVKEVRSLLPTSQQRAKMQEEFENIADMEGLKSM
jgi:ParB-like chromosome segregation protein Spo0J